jgi:hypothetical protein
MRKVRKAITDNKLRRPDRLVQPEQNTKLYREYLNEPGFAVSRPRGQSPQQCAFFTRSAQQEESSLLASLCSLLGALTRTGAPVNRQALANLSRGELLCQAFEVYHDLVADPHISFEHLVFLVSACGRRGAGPDRLRGLRRPHRGRPHYLQGAPLPVLRDPDRVSRGYSLSSTACAVALYDYL